MGRRLGKEIALDATPEQVWEAIATGPGISAWFVPSEVSGGVIRQDFGSGFVVEGAVTTEEPGRRFAYGAFQPSTEGQADYAFEFLVEGSEGGSTVLRFVQSGFLDEGWEGEYSSFDAGWDMFFANLAAYLRHFADRSVVNVVTMGFTTAPRDEAWTTFHRALGLAGPPSVGDEVRLAPVGLPEITGVVDLATPEFLGVRSTDALYRFGAEGTDGCGVSAYHYLYGAHHLDDTSADARQDAWQQWLTGLFPAPAQQAPVS